MVLVRIFPLSRQSGLGQQHGYILRCDGALRRSSSSNDAAADIVRYLREHFPNLIHLFSDPENLHPEVPEPYSSSGLLTEEMLRRQEDATLLESFYSALNDMATSREYWMQETLADLLEGLIHDEAFVAKLRPHLNPQANEKLEAALS